MSLITNFNSIKVQLKRIGWAINIRDVEFQFHKGTIKTDISLRWWRTPPYFNSIKVQLKQQRAANIDSMGTNFNSIKVQLKRLRTSSVSCCIRFQFHKGTIKTDFTAGLHHNELDFNSIKVQLKLPSCVVEHVSTLISIP